MAKGSAVSVIIITKNEAENITGCIEGARMASDDIIVIDSGSTDATVALAEKAGARVITVLWEGFGAARNAGAKVALNDWILAIDADERVTRELANAVGAINTGDEAVIYGFKRQNYFLGKKIRFGEWGRDKVYRLYNRKRVAWDLSPIHEHPVGENTTHKMIGGAADHYPVTREEQNTEKTIRYATLNAEKFYMRGKKATFVKRFLSPAFNFFKCYVLLLGFLDGKEGFAIARVTSYYVWLKYDLLHKLYLREGGVGCSKCQ